MPEPWAICIEDLNAASEATRYLRCVALPGRQPGLRVDAEGTVLWKSDDDVACELWVSADDCLILYRPEGAASVTLHRAGRSLDVPCGKPVVLLDKDNFDVGERRLRLHVHGVAPAVAPPSPLPVASSPVKRLAQAAAAAAVIGAAATGCIDVRETPPSVVVPPDPTPTIDVRENPPTFDVPTGTPTPTIEVRLTPPTATPPPPPVDDTLLARALLGAWDVTYGPDALSVGTLEIFQDSYTFTPAEGMPKALDLGEIAFLLDRPEGEVTFFYGGAARPPDLLSDHAPGDDLLTMTFPSEEGAAEFTVRMSESALNLLPADGAEAGWQIVRDLSE